MAKVLLKQPILNLDGKPFKDYDENSKVKGDLTFGDMFISLLSTPKEKDNKKMEKYRLAVKCVADEADMNIDEKKLVKDLAEEAFVSPIIYGRICDLLEGEEPEEKSKKKGK